MELATANFSEGNASGPEPPTSEPPPLFGLGVENFITLVVFSLIFALGVLGNSLVITVLARSKPGKPRGTTNLFILNLSIADLAYLLFCIPFQATVYVLPTWVLGAFICKFTHYFFTVSMLVSIFTLAAMSVDRYVAIVHSRRSSSLRVSRNALLGVGFIWTLSFAMASPVAYHQGLFHQDGSNQTFCWEQWPNQSHKKAYVVCTFVFGYLLPLLLICFCYAKVGAWRSRRERENGGAGARPRAPLVSAPAEPPHPHLRVVFTLGPPLQFPFSAGSRTTDRRQSWVEFGGLGVLAFWSSGRKAFSTPLLVGTVACKARCGQSTPLVQFSPRDPGCCSNSNQSTSARKRFGHYGGTCRGSGAPEGRLVARMGSQSPVTRWGGSRLGSLLHVLVLASQSLAETALGILFYTEVQLYKPRGAQFSSEVVPVSRGPWWEGWECSSPVASGFRKAVWSVLRTSGGHLASPGWGGAQHSSWLGFRLPSLPCWGWYSSYLTDPLELHGSRLCH